MSPIIQTLGNASAYGYRSFAAADTGSFESIATATGTGSSSTITFSSIPSTYTHLQIRGIGKSVLSTPASSDYAKMYFNGDTSTANYYAHQLYGDGSTAASDSLAGTYLNIIQRWPRAAATNVFGAMVLDIDRKSTRLNSSHVSESRMPSSA